MLIARHGMHVRHVAGPVRQGQHHRQAQPEHGRTLRRNEGYWVPELVRNATRNRHIDQAPTVQVGGLTGFWEQRDQEEATEGIAALSPDAVTPAFVVSPPFASQRFSRVLNSSTEETPDEPIRLSGDSATRCPDG